MQATTSISLFNAFLLALLSSACLALQIDLPRGTRSEGVTHAAGSNFLAADFFTGNLYLIDVYSRLITTAVRAPPGRQTAGIWATRSHIFAAGTGSAGAGRGPTPTLHVYDTVTGSAIASCEVMNGTFVNDVVANHMYAYFTDSGRAQMYRMTLSALPQCDIKYIPLEPRELFEGAPGGQPGFYANGIATFYAQGLLVANSNEETIFFVDTKDGGYKATKILPSKSLPTVDGIERVRNLLYVAQNRLNKVSVWRLGFSGKTRRVTMTFVKDITKPGEFATPTTVAVSKNRLVVANFNFNAPFTFPITDTFTLTYLRI